MTAVELITAVTPFFTFIRAVMTNVEETYIFGVSAANILYGIGFVALTLQAYHRVTQPQKVTEE